MIRLNSSPVEVVSFSRENLLANSRKPVCVEKWGFLHIYGVILEVSDPKLGLILTKIIHIYGVILCKMPPIYRVIYVDFILKYGPFNKVTICPVHSSVLVRVSTYVKSICADINSECLSPQ